MLFIFLGFDSNFPLQNRVRLSSSLLGVRPMRNPQPPVFWAVAARGCWNLEVEADERVSALSSSSRSTETLLCDLDEIFVESRAGEGGEYFVSLPHVVSIRFLHLISFTVQLPWARSAQPCRLPPTARLAVS